MSKKFPTLGAYIKPHPPIGNTFCFGSGSGLRREIQRSGQTIIHYAAHLGIFVKLVSSDVVDGEDDLDIVLLSLLY